MLRKLDAKNMGKSNKGWLNSLFHFSFAEYYNPQNIQFGALRVINDDLVVSNEGFDTHPHKNMEIISYVVDGALTHADSMGNHHTLKRGEVQYMSAGTGVLHSEHNFGEEILRFLQIWILPDAEDYEPNYGDYRFIWNERHNQWLYMVSAKGNEAPIKINQDVNIYVTQLDKGKKLSFPLKVGRQAYVVQIEGESMINDILMKERDGLEAIEENLVFKASEKAHIMVVEMAKP